MPVLVSDIVSAVITELSQVPGIATQIYSAGRIQQFVQDAFLIEFDSFNWPPYLFYSDPIPLSGTDGRLTVDLAGPLGPVDDYADVVAVWPENSQRKLTALPDGMNPNALNGAHRMHIAPDYAVLHRPFRVYPMNAAGSVVVRAMQRPALPFAKNSPIYMDGLLLQYDACWMYAVDDGTVPAQVQKYQMLAAQRRKVVQANFSSQPIDLDGRYGSLPMDAVDDSYFVLDQDPLA